MVQNETVAIIGATERVGVQLAQSILRESYRLLLMDDDAERLNALKNQIFAPNNNTVVEVNNCCKNASWEADIIIIALPANQQVKIAQKIKEVATQKIVLIINPLEDSVVALEEMLPYSKLVHVFINSQAGKNYNVDKQSAAIFKGKDATSVFTAKKIIEGIWI